MHTYVINKHCIPWTIFTHGESRITPTFWLNPRWILSLKPIYRFLYGASTLTHIVLVFHSNFRWGFALLRLTFLCVPYCVLSNCSVHSVFIFWCFYFISWKCTQHCKLLLLTCLCSFYTCSVFETGTSTGSHISYSLWISFNVLNIWI
jgi:hypothetical protein